MGGVAHSERKADLKVSGILAKLGKKIDQETEKNERSAVDRVGCESPAFSAGRNNLSRVRRSAIGRSISGRPSLCGCDGAPN